MPRPPLVNRLSVILSQTSGSVIEVARRLKPFGILANFLTDEIHNGPSPAFSRRDVRELPPRTPGRASQSFSGEEGRAEPVRLQSQTYPAGYLLPRRRMWHHDSMPEVTTPAKTILKTDRCAAA